MGRAVSAKTVERATTSRGSATAPQAGWAHYAKDSVLKGSTAVNAHQNVGVRMEEPAIPPQENVIALQGGRGMSAETVVVLDFGE